MDTVTLSFAILIGFTGSLHCVGMCGPIALALPYSGRPLLTRLLYNGGRLFTYGIIGILAGLLGVWISNTGFQRSLSITAGSLILFNVLIRFIYPMHLRSAQLIGRWSEPIRNLFRDLLGRRSLSTMFLIGTVNGFLPCGFVYLAAAGAATSAVVWHGAAYMVGFGLGTVPAMLMVSFAGGMIGPNFRAKFSSLTPWVAAGIAGWLIYRGVTFDPMSCCRHH